MSVNRKFEIIKAQKLFSAVKEAIDKWNPYSLLPDSPEDEFDGESRMIASRISENSTVEEIMAVVSIVFSEMFEPEYFKVGNCREVAETIKNNIEKIV